MTIGLNVVLEKLVTSISLRSVPEDLSFLLFGTYFLVSPFSLTLRVVSVH